MIPSRQTFLVPLMLPSRLLKRLDAAQLQAIAFDRIPLDPASARVWILRPRLGFFSRGTATAFAVVCPVNLLPSDPSKVLPEDVLLAALAGEKRLSKGGIVALDSPECLSLLVVSPGVRTVTVEKHFSGAATSPLIQAPPTALRRGSILLRLDAGGSAEPILSRHGAPVTEDAAQSLSNQIDDLRSEKRWFLSPDLLNAAKTSARVDESHPAVKAAPRVGLRAAAAFAALILPLAALWLAKERQVRRSAAVVEAMSVSYENRFGAKHPDPLLALKSKAQSVPSAGRSPAVPLQAWLAAANRLSAGAGAASLRLDEISLDGVRVEVRGTASDPNAVARWVSELSGDPGLAEAALVSSENRMRDSRTAFLVRAKFRMPE